MRSGDQSPHELWMSHELLLPDLSLGKKPPTLHLASSHIEVCFCNSYLSLLIFNYSPKTVQLGEEAVRLVVARMPALKSLKVSSWDIDYHWFMKNMKEEAKRENLDITYL